MYDNNHAYHICGLNNVLNTANVGKFTGKKKSNIFGFKFAREEFQSCREVRLWVKLSKNMII